MTRAARHDCVDIDGAPVHKQSRLYHVLRPGTQALYMPAPASSPRPHVNVLGYLELDATIYPARLIDHNL